MKVNKPLFIIQKEFDKESTGENSIKNNENMTNLFKEKETDSEFAFGTKNNEYFFKSDEISLSHNRLFEEDANLNFENGFTSEFQQTKEFNLFSNNYDFLNENSFKKNRNNFENNLLNEKEEKEKQEANDQDNKSKRIDKLLIKFKAALGKWFLNDINEKLEDLRKKLIIKRRIKFFAFNYKKFTLIVSYTQNQQWLKEKMIDLLLIGDEENQEKTKNSIKTLYKKDLMELKEIKQMLESYYEDIIQRFYSSEEFNKFKENNKVKEMDDYFKKIMNMSLLEKNGFIKFMETRKGNIRIKKE